MGYDEPETIKRLKSLRRGEAFVYYKGDFAGDINRSLRVDADCPNTVPAVAYGYLLQDIQDTAIELEKQGRIVLTERTTELPIPNPQRGVLWDRPRYIAEYIATGYADADSE